MSTETVLTVCVTGIAAIALLIQGIALWGIRNALQSVNEHIDTLSADVQKKLGTVADGVNELMDVLKPVAQNIQAVQERLAATGAVIHKRVVDVDAFIEETTQAARLQVARIQDLVDTVSRQVEDAFETVHKGIVAPVTEVGAIMRGVKVALDILFRRSKTPSRHLHQDEEMFI